MTLTKKIEIKKAETCDLEALHLISYATFFDSFAEESTLQDITSYLDKCMTTSAIATQLNEEGTAFYLLKVKNRLVGYFKLKFMPSPDKTELDDAMELERLYVLSKYQNMGYGEILLNKALELAGKSNYTTIWLGVWSKNLKAINFYRNRNFEEFGETDFFVGRMKQKDLLMKRSIP